MTRSEIRDRILSALNESTSAPVFWTTAQMDAVIDEASEVLAEEARIVRRSAFVTRQQGMLYYSIRGIASDVMAITRIWLPDVNRRLAAVSIAELDAQNLLWSTVTGIPEYWFPLSWDLFGVYPHPAAGGGLLKVDYLAWPRALLDDDDTPEFRDADQEALVLYGIYEGLLKSWNAERAGEVFTRFLESIGVSRARNSVRESQARSYQRPRAPGHPFSSGVRP